MRFGAELGPFDSRRVRRQRVVSGTMTTTNMSQAGCVVVGGGPGGMVLALLLARQGVDVLLLEARENFEREFRGDTVHPSTLELLEELELLDRVSVLAEARGYDFPIHLPDGSIITVPREPIPSRFNESWNVPQTAFLELLAEAAQLYPNFRLELGARVEELVEDGESIRGVRYRTRNGLCEVMAPLVIGADGRFSKVRQLAGLPLVNTAQEVDLLWMRLPQLPSDPPRSYGLYMYGQDQFVVSDRGDEWQIAFVLPKASYNELRRAGIQTLRDKLSRVMPWLADRTDLLRDWDNTSLLVVQVGRVKQWYRSGLLLIGDAAHVMSPVFGIGINYAIQDAVVAANVLGPRLRAGDVRIRDLRCVQRRREWPMRVMQWLQEVQKYQQLVATPAPGMRMAGWLAELPPMRKLRLRLIAFGGFRPERLQGARQSPRVSSTSDTRDAESRRHRRASSASASQSAAANVRQSQNLASSS
jgi:2-polyprenyl-6-methoxyphenol hydroxylase-like FAD-dependent oxidoreductase